MVRLFRFRILLRLPSLLRLSLQLLRDARVPVSRKAAALGAIALVLSPFDLLGWIPIVGQGFDIVVIVNILERFISAAPRDVVLEHIAALGLEGKVRL